MSVLFRRSVPAWSLVLVCLGGVQASAAASDPSAYRGFRLGMSLPAVAAEAAVPAADARTIIERPMLIQELVWRPGDARRAGAADAEHTVTQVLFGFCNGELYRMVVAYNPDRTEGMTEQDLVDALSAVYGVSRRLPADTPIIISSASLGYNETQPIVARWDDAAASVNLFHGTYRSAFGLVIFSRALAPVARAGLETGLRLAMLDAPRREAAEELARQEAERLLHAQARAANKAAFKY